MNLNHGIDSAKGQGLGKVVTERGSFLKDPTLFDYVEFGVTQLDAVTMSPATARLIELAFLALVDSGIEYRGRNVGAFMAGTNYAPIDLVRA